MPEGSLASLRTICGALLRDHPQSPQRRRCWYLASCAPTHGSKSTIEFREQNYPPGCWGKAMWLTNSPEPKAMNHWVGAIYSKGPRRIFSKVGRFEDRTTRRMAKDRCRVPSALRRNVTRRLHPRREACFEQYLGTSRDNIEITVVIPLL